MPQQNKATAKAKDGDRIKVHYTGKLKDESIFDSSQGGEPLEVTLGAGQVLPGFENAMLGMRVGDSKTFDIEAEEAYGPYREELLVKIDKKQLPDDFHLEAGQQLVLRQTEGPPISVMVADVSGEFVTLDANHPLAGEALTFEVQLVEIVSAK